MTQYISTTDTAKLIRKALKESFPGVKFSVRSSKYSGGSSIRVSWVDGPNDKQVKAITDLFEGSYTSSMEDYKGSQYFMVDGKRTRFGADFVFCERKHSDKLLQNAIDATWLNHLANWESANIEKPTVEQYRKGELWNVRCPHMHIFGNQSIQTDINQNLYKRSSFAYPEKSETLKGIKFLGDEGYGQSSVGKVHLTVVETD